MEARNITSAPTRCAAPSSMAQPRNNARGALPRPTSAKSIDVFRGRIALACLLASLLPAGCQRLDAPVAAPSVATPAPDPAKVDGAAASSASLAGVEHDSDPDPALLRDPFMLPGPLSSATGPDGLRRIYG